MKNSIKEINSSIKQRKESILIEYNQPKSSKKFIFYSIVFMILFNFSIHLSIMSFPIHNASFANFYEFLRTFIVDFSGDDYEDQYVIYE